MSQPFFIRGPDDLVGLGPSSRLAIDTEFHGERRYVPTLHLIQMRTDEGPTWLLDPHDTAVVEAVAPLLRACTWILHAGRHDLVLLNRALGGVPDTVLDTQIAAGLVNPRYPAGLARLLDRELGITLAKAETLSDWSRRPLTPDQIGYAAEDVAHLHALWDRLAMQAYALGRSEQLLAVCQWERAQALTPRPIEDAWRTVNGRHSLEPRAVGILQRLAAWREERARQENQPPHSVLSNGVMLNLAKRAPATLEELLASRRAPKTLLRRHADAVLRCIATPPPSRWSAPETLPPGGAAAARMQWLQAYASCRGVEHSWGSRLVLPTPVLEQIALGQQPREALTPWRWDLTGDDLVLTLAGERSLRPPDPPC